MDDLGHALALMHGARNRFRSVRFEAREWHHAERGRRALERRRARPSGSGVVTALSRRDADVQPPASFTVSRVWWSKPDRLREEVESFNSKDQATVRVVHGERWAFLSGGELHSSDLLPGSASPPFPALARLLDPALLLVAVDLEVAGRASVASRDGIRIVARPREIGDPLVEGHGLPVGADEHELIVDAAVGALLRVTSRIDGEEFAVTEVVDVAFDEDMPDERFVLVAPPGVRFAEPPPPLPRPTTREVTLAEAARTLPFTLLALTPLPPGWELASVRVNVVHPAVVPQATLSYRLDGGARSLSVIEAASGSTPLGDIDEELVERDGLRFRAAQVPDVRVRFERHRTDVRLSGGGLPLDVLLRIAASFRPVSTASGP